MTDGQKAVTSRHFSWDRIGDIIAICLSVCCLGGAVVRVGVKMEVRETETETYTQ